MSARDDELSRRLAATLDSSIEMLDADTRARLATMRRAALQSRRRRSVGGLALAASIAALVLVPWSLRQAPTLDMANSGNEDMAYLSVDPQMLDDMEMLQGMDELQNGEELLPRPTRDRQGAG